MVIFPAFIRLYSNCFAMRNLLFLSLAIFFTVTSFGQKAFRNNTVYAEIGGNGLVLSANIEQHIGKKPGWLLHAGIGLGGSKPVIPLGVKYLFDLHDARSFIEAGLGLTMIDLDFLDSDVTGLDESPYRAVFIPSAGYRHQTPYGLMWRINATPVISNVRTFIFGGLSVGWSF